MATWGLPWMPRSTLPQAQVWLTIESDSKSKNWIRRRRTTLTFFGSHIFSFDTTTVYSVYTDEHLFHFGRFSRPRRSGARLRPTLHNRDRVATISNLSPQTDNILYVQFVGSAGFEGYLNDMQIESSATQVLFGDYNNDDVG